MSAAQPAPSSPEIRTSTNRLLTPDELAVRWGVGKAQVYRLTREGRLDVVRIGRYYRYRLAAVEAFELRGGVETHA